MREAVDLEYILVGNESEALALETNLIKERKPRFNILLKDDKSYPYVKLTLADRYPKVFVTRRLLKDGAAYFGPYFPGSLAYRVVELIHRSFLIPSCKVDLSRYHPRACLQYYIHRCLGPCVEGLTTPEIYANAVRDAQLLLEGKHAELERALTARMMAAADAEQFEAAARLRDQLSTVHQLQEKQRAATAEQDDEADVFGYHYEDGSLAVNLFHVRAGKIVDRREFFWEDLPELLEATKEEHPNTPQMTGAPGPSPLGTWDTTNPNPSQIEHAIPCRRSLQRPAQAALYRSAIRSAQHPRPGRLRRPRNSGRIAQRAHRPSHRAGRAAARRKALPCRPRRPKRQAVLYATLPRA